MEFGELGSEESAEESGLLKVLPSEKDDDDKDKDKEGDKVAKDGLNEVWESPREGLKEEEWEIDLVKLTGKEREVDPREFVEVIEEDDAG